MSKRIIIAIVVLVAIAGGVIALTPALRAKFSRKADEATITVKPGPDDVELIEVSDRPFDSENLESESPHAPIQVQGDTPENPGKVETKSKEAGEK